MLRFIVRKLTSRTVKIILFTLLVVPPAAWLAVRVSLMVKVRQAEALLSQVKSLRIRESTFQDAQQLAERYPGKVEYRGGLCTLEKCTYVIFLGTSWDHQPDSIASALRLVGIRTYRVDGSVQVRNGRIMEVAFDVDTEAKLGAAGDNGSPHRPRFPIIFREATTTLVATGVLTNIPIDRSGTRTLLRVAAGKSYCLT